MLGGAVPAHAATAPAASHASAAVARACLPFASQVMMHPIMGALRHDYGGPWEVGGLGSVVAMHALTSSGRRHGFWPGCVHSTQN